MEVFEIVQASTSCSINSNATYMLNRMQATVTMSLSSTIIACLLINCNAPDNRYVPLLFSTTIGNFGVVNKAWYEKENVQVKVAIKTLKGKFY